MIKLHHELLAVVSITAIHLYLNSNDVEGILVAPRLITSIIMLFFVPGYLLQALFFAHKDALDVLERIVYSVGMSIATVPPMALLLDYAPFLDLSAAPILASQIILVSGASLLSFTRRALLPIDERFQPQIAVPVQTWWQTQRTTDRLLYGVVAAALLITMSMIVVIMTSPAPAARLTEFYLVGEAGLAEAFPASATVGEPIEINYGIINREGEPLDYRVAVTSNNQELALSDVIELEHEATIEGSLSVSLDAANPDQALNIYLLVDDLIYRELRLWVNVALPENSN